MTAVDQLRALVKKWRALDSWVGVDFPGELDAAVDAVFSLPVPAQRVVAMLRKTEQPGDDRHNMELRDSWNAALDAVLDACYSPSVDRLADEWRDKATKLRALPRPADLKAQGTAQGMADTLDCCADEI